MPIRKDLLHLYRGPEWKATRDRILAAADNKCERCKKPNGAWIYTYTWQTWAIVAGEKVKSYHMIWIKEGSKVWRNQHGWPVSPISSKGLPRKIRVVLTVAHADNQPENMNAGNLRCWCAWCHLAADRVFHGLTRSIRKDGGRPVLNQVIHQAEESA